MVFTQEMYGICIYFASNYNFRATSYITHQTKETVQIFNIWHSLGWWQVGCGVTTWSFTFT